MRGLTREYALVRVYTLYYKVYTRASASLFSPGDRVVIVQSIGNASPGDKLLNHTETAV